MMRNKKHGLRHDVVRRFFKNKLAVLGLVVLTVLILMAIFANLIANYNDLALLQNTSIRNQPMSAEHIFGTDQYGRDLFARIVHGSRYSLFIGFSCASLALLVGGIIGAVAGFYGGLRDSLLMRTMDVLLALPMILLAIAIISAMGPGMKNLIIALSIAMVPVCARLVRVSVMSIREQEYIEAARSIGVGDAVIILRHILPNVMGPIIIQFTLLVANGILAASGLSFIGLGVQPPTPEWGNLLAEGAQVFRYSPYLVIFPGIAIFFTVLAINLLGDGLRDAFDPRLK